ncbi:MAG: DJ-1/PfpI family protein [Deltaproteobacteria bacterium]|nr:DJ-1/PfpI family protein [Deltaproteobacteria bacterium]
MSDKSLAIGMLVFPRLTQLDLTGPYEAFARIPDAKVHLLWKRVEPVTSDTGLSLLPTMTLAECPPLDVLCVPGGPGQIDLMDDEEVIAFVRKQGLQAQYVTSVCTGSLVLGAAGLLSGYEATTHWMSMDQLELFGAKPVKKRIVRDRNRITGGGVTAGIDFALYLAGVLVGEQTARICSFPQTKLRLLGFFRIGTLGFFWILLGV